MDAWRTAVDAKWPQYRQSNGFVPPEPEIAQDLYHAKGRIVVHMKQRHRDFAVALAELTDLFRRMANGTMAEQAKQIYQAKVKSCMLSFTTYLLITLLLTQQITRN